MLFFDKQPQDLFLTETLWFNYLKNLIDTQTSVCLTFMSLIKLLLNVGSVYLT